MSGTLVGSRQSASRLYRREAADPFVGLLGSGRGSGRCDPVGDEALYCETDEVTGDTCWYRYPGGPRHREHGPAIQYANGSRSFYRDGKLHRIGAPAVVDTDGGEAWFVNGERHREDGPALTENGMIAYYFHDRLHREDGPARVSKECAEYWVNGQLHRIGGPAIIWRDSSSVAYYLHGEQVVAPT